MPFFWVVPNGWFHDVVIVNQRDQARIYGQRDDHMGYSESRVSHQYLARGFKEYLVGKLVLFIKCDGPLA